MTDISPCHPSVNYRYGVLAYDGYLLLKLEFLESDMGITEAIDALVLVCPDPVVRNEAHEQH